LTKIYRALTIAGSDSGGGAGIQEDLKTFMALGVHGMSAITAITAQNTVEVTGIQDITPDMVVAQIRAVSDDIGVDSVKTGMLHTRAIIEAVAGELEKYGFPMVVDPVMISKSGAALLLPEAKQSLIEKILPLATVLTPNAMEAEAISGFKIKNIEDGKKAAKTIASMGPKAVVVKGGHLFKSDKAIDILFLDGEFILLEGERHATKDTHGTGCSFASAIAAGLAKGHSIQESVKEAKEFVNYAIRYGLRLGKGSGPLNPAALLYNKAERYEILDNIRSAVELLESCPEVRNLVAEVQMNVGMALPYATVIGDIAAVEGRISKVPRGVRATGCPRFGVSSHIARTILAVKRFDDTKRACINLKYDEAAVDVLKSFGLIVSYYDRREEPLEIKNREGGTTFWGAEQAVERAGKVPDVIYHLGDWGKEPIISIVGSSAVEVAKIAVNLAEELYKK
jgi:hydroxymethylpyrimidine/phosphomethylpyrimidine kinase